MSEEITVRELIERLEEQEDQDAIVRLGTQANWPLQFKLAGVVSSADLVHLDRDGYIKEEDDVPAEDGPVIVYLVEGGHPWDGSPYAPRALWDSI